MVVPAPRPHRAAEWRPLVPARAEENNSPVADGLVFAAIAPHGGLAIAEACTAEDRELAAATRAGLEELGRLGGSLDGAGSPQQGYVLRGGRIEPGEPTDLPLTINTVEQGRRWCRAMNSVRHCQISGWIQGCNMAMRRNLVDRLGLFDEAFGPGAHICTAEDTEYIFRAYTPTP